MTKICWWLVNVVSRMLEPEERDAVRGDLAESGDTAVQMLRGLLGLVVRRQVALWKDWRPWLSLVGLVVPLGILLSLVSRRMANGTAIYVWMYANNFEIAYLGNRGYWLDLAHMGGAVVALYASLMCWSWTSGLMLGSLSSRTIRTNGVLFFLMLLTAAVLRAPPNHFGVNAAVFEGTFYRVIFPVIVMMVLVLVPSTWGMRHGLKLASFPQLARVLVWVSAIATVRALAIHWFSPPLGDIEAHVWPLTLALVSPAAYVVIAATWHHWRIKTVLE